MSIKRNQVRGTSGGGSTSNEKMSGSLAWSIGVIQSGAERVGVVEFAADVHGEFKFPTQRFDDVGGCDFIAV